MNKFYRLSVILWAQNVLMPPFLILPPSTNFYNFLRNFILFLRTFKNFYHLPPIFITFYQFLPTFIALSLTFTIFHQFCQILSLLINFYTTFNNFCHICHLPPILYYFSLSKTGSIFFICWHASIPLFCWIIWKGH